MGKKRTDYDPQNVRIPAIPESISDRDLKNAVSDPGKKAIFGADIENPETPKSSFDPKIQHGIKEAQFGGGNNATWITEKHGIIRPPVTVTATTTLFTNEQVVLVDASGGAITLTLPKGQHGKSIVIKKIDGSANAITIDGDDSETIDGTTTISLSAQFDTVEIIFDNVSGGWFIIGSY